MPNERDIKNIDDARALKALAHPLRLDLLEAVKHRGPLTATEAAEIVGESPANCSWHLRQLEKYGFIEVVPGSTGRQRPYQRTATWYDWKDTGPDPEWDAASRALTEVFIDREVELIKQARSRPQPEGWAESSLAAQTILWLDLAEAERLGSAIIALLDEYKSRLLDPSQRPHDSRPFRFLTIGAADDNLGDRHD